MVAFHAAHIPLAGTPQRLLDGADAVDSIRIPTPAAQDRSLAPWPGIASRAGTHPSSLAPFVARQSIRKTIKTNCDARRTRLARPTGRRPEWHSDSDELPDADRSAPRRILSNLISTTMS